MNFGQLLTHFEKIVDTPDSIERLRRFFLGLAVRGRLVDQNTDDEPATELLERVSQERKSLDQNKARKTKIVPEVDIDTLPFEVPTQWKWATVQELMNVEMGQSPPSEYYNKTGEGLPFYQGKADFGKRHPTPTSWCTNPKKVALPGDILISVSAPVGPTNIADSHCCIGRGLAALRPYSGVDTDYVLLSLKAFEESLEAIAYGSTFVAITKKQLTSFLLTLPPFAEQQRIVAKVGELMVLCDKLEESLSIAATRRLGLLDALLHEALTA